ncbi:MAG: hypothetical protein V1682_06095 [Candidatus Omnitrophota bacterium]
MKWHYDGNLSTVNIDVNYGSGWSSLATNIGADSGAAGYNLYPAQWADGVPDQVSNNVQFRIKDSSASYNDVTTTDSQTFGIIARFDITFPESGSPVYAEDATDITWNTYNVTTLTHAKLEYTINNGLDWFVITDGIPDYSGGPDNLVLNSGSCTWTPAANLLTTGGRIRISDPASPNSLNEGAGTFPIYGSIDVTAPLQQGGNPILWDVGTTKTISWTFKGDITYVSLWYSTTGDAGPWTQIVTDPSPYSAESGDAASKAGSYSWPIPVDTPLSTNAFIRVSKSDQAAIVYGLSDQLKIKGSVALVHPDRINFPATDSIYRVYGGDIPQACLIDWTTVGLMQNIVVKYTTNGNDWVLIDTIPRLTATEKNWSIPGSDSSIIGTGRMVKVYDADNELDTFAISETFEIKGEIKLDTPTAAGGVTYTIKGIPSEPIQWTPYGAFPGNQVLISGTTDDFDPAHPENTFEIALRPAGTSGTQQTYDWDVYTVMPGSDPVPISGTVKIRVQDYSDAVVKDTSGNITTKGALRITTPTQVWYVDDTNRSVTWDYDGPIQLVDIYLRNATDSGWIRLTPEAGYDCTVKLFNVLPEVPDAILSASRLRIVDHNDATGTVEAISGNFAVRGRLTFVAGQPAEDQVFIVGPEQPGEDNTIAWTMNGTFTTVEIRYSIDNGATFPEGNIIATGHNASSPFVWDPVNDDMSQIVKFKVIDERDPDNVFAISPRVAIAGSITVTHTSDYTDPAKVPLKVGNTFSIYWSKTGLGLTNVDIMYSTDGGSTFPNSIIVGLGATASPYDWVVEATDPLSPNAVIKVADHSNPTATFGVSPSFHLQGILEWDPLDPDGDPGQTPPGKIWYVGEDYVFKWLKTGLISKVDLYYTTDGTNWLDLPEGGNPPTGLPNTGNFTWTVPDTANIISDTVKLKIVDHNDTTNFLDSGVFMIKGYLEVNSPIGTSEWYADSSHNITWEKRGQQLETINIYYSYSLDGSTWTNYLDNKLNTTPVDASQGATGFPWTVHLGANNEITPYVKAKIVNTQDEYTFNESDTFKVKGLIEIVPPNQHPLEGDEWVSDDVETISWTKHGNIPAVKIEYSNTGETPDYVIAKLPPNGSEYVTENSFNWTVPDTVLSDRGRIRVSNTADPAEKPTTAAISGAFRIMPSLAITKPALNDVVPVNLAGDADNLKYKIEWDVHGVVSKVKLEYSYGGGGFTVITGASDLNAETTPGSGKGEFLWRVPNNINDNVIIRATDNDTGQTDVTDDSAQFSIAGSLTFNVANGLPNAVYAVDEQASINWTTRGTVDYVKIQYCTNGTDFNYTVVPNAAYPDGCPAGLQTFLWTIPNPNQFTDEVRIKISDNNAALNTIGDESDETFEIRGAIDILSPVPPPNPVVWIVDTPQVIRWRIHGAIATVKVEYSPTGLDADYVTVAGGSTVAGDTDPSGDSIGELPWTPPSESVGTSVRIRVTNISDTDVKALSSPFIIRGGFQFLQANGDKPLLDDRWPVKSYQDIEWTTFGNIQTVRIWYTADGTNPDTATWTELTPIIGVTNTGTFNWPGNVPESVHSKKAMIKIAAANDLDAKGYSPMFTIHDVIYLDRPNGTDNPLDAKILLVGAAEDIKWHTEASVGGITKVKIDYSIAGGEAGSWLPIVAQTDDDGTYSWSPIPGRTPEPGNLTTIGDQIRIRVMDALVDDEVFDVSENNIAVRAKFTVTQPNSTTTWYSEDGDDGSVKIQWTTNPSVLADVPKVNMYYTTDGSSWSQILDQVAPIETAPYDNDGEFEWKVPKVQKTSIARVRVFDSRYTDSYGESALFSVKGRLIVDYPVSNNTPATAFRCGVLQNLKWTTKGFIPTIGVEYIYDSTPHSIGSSHVNENNLDWTPQNFSSKAVTIRVYDITDATVQGTSQAFWVLPNITVTKPDVTSTWGYNTPHDITWNTSGPIATVDIEYSKDSMATWTTPKVASAWDLATNGNLYHWTVPNAVSGNCYVRVADTSSLNDNGTPANPADDYYETYDISEKFRIRASFELVSPNIGTPVRVDAPLDIQWKQYGDTSTVYIYYKSDADGQVRPIKETYLTVDDGIVATPVPVGEIYTYHWTVPDFIKSDVRVGIADPGDDINMTKDESDVVFAIKPLITVIWPYRTSPADFSKWDIGSTQTIKWNWTGTVYDVNISYSLNGVDWDGITAVHDLVNDPDKETTIDWYINPVLPDLMPSKDFYIKVEDARSAVASEGVSGQSSLLADFTLTDIPQGTEYVVNDPYTIQWACVGSVSYVKLDYSTDGGGTFPAEHLIIASTENDYSYPWNMPNDISRQVRVRISSTVDEDANDVMGHDFRIKGAIQVTSPGSSSVWGVGQVYGLGQPPPRTPGIAWATTGDIPDVKITYSIMSGDPAVQGPFNPIMETLGETNNDGVVPNTGNCSWTIPDEVTANAIIRVQDSRDAASPVGDQTDVLDESDGFHIVGWFQFIGFKDTATGQLIPMNNNRTPGDTADDYYQLSVESSYDIAWRWGGTIPLARITYSTNGSGGTFNSINENYEIVNDGIVPNGVGAGGPASEFTYTWTIPDTISPDCRVHIADSGDETVYCESDKFKIQGAFILVSPITMCDNGTPADPADDFMDYRWITDEVHDVIWTSFGTINNVDLYYSKDDFADLNSDGVPDNQTVMVDSNGANALGISTAVGGPIYNNNNTPGDTSDDTLVFKWRIPDDISNNVSIRIYDAVDHEVYAQGPKALSGQNKMEIDWATITFDIRDLTTNQPVEGLNVNGTDGWLSESIVVPKTHDVKASPAAGPWEATFSNESYGTITIPYMVGWDAGNNKWVRDRIIYSTMETTVVHIWRAYAEFSYDADTDRLDITSWLERDGRLVPGALIIDVSIFDGTSKIMRKTVLVDDNLTPDDASDDMFYYYQNILDEDDVSGGAKLWVGDRMGVQRTMADVIAECVDYKIGEAPVPAGFPGFFGQHWGPPTSYHISDPAPDGTDYTKLQAGKVYTVASYIGLASGATFKTPVSFTVTIPKKMADMETAITDMIQTVNDVPPMLAQKMDEQTVIIQGVLDTQTGIIETKLEDQRQVIVDATVEMKDTIDESMMAFESAVADSVDLLKSSAALAGAAAVTSDLSAKMLESTAKKYSWKAMVSPDPAMAGDTVTLTLQGQPSLSPMLDIYSWDNEIILNDVPLEDPEGKGVYSYDFEADGRFMPGKGYTFVIVEETTQGFAAGSGMVESMSLSTIAGLASAAPEAARVAKNALDAIKAVEAVVISGENINIALTLKNLKESVDALPATMAKEGPSARMTQAVDDISSRLKKLAGEEGYDFGTMLETAISESPTLNEMRTRTDSINEVVAILQQIFEAKFGGKEAPFTSTSLQTGSVKFRIAAVNPSKIKAQKMTIKYYLPAEAKPKDVISTGGLDLEYDPEKGIYYAYKVDVELAPAEVRVFEVHVEDVWMVPEDNLTELKTRTDSILAKLEKTDYYGQAKAIADIIYPRLDEIRRSQADENVSRETHIGVYRQNVESVAKTKEDIGRLEKILVTAGGPPAPDMLAKTKIKANEPTKTMTWILIFVIMIFIGLLTAVLFFTWMRQAHITKEALLESKNSAFPDQMAEEKKE